MLYCTTFTEERDEDGYAVGCGEADGCAAGEGVEGCCGAEIDES